MLRALQHVGLQPQPPGELVLEDEVRLALVADALLHLDVQVLPDLLADGERRRAAAVRRGVDLEGVEAERVADRLRQLRRRPRRSPAACARCASEICWPSPSGLIGWLNTISDRMSASSSGGVLDRTISGFFSVPRTLTRASTP